MLPMSSKLLTTTDSGVVAMRIKKKKDFVRGFEFLWNHTEDFSGMFFWYVDVLFIRTGQDVVDTNSNTRELYALVT